ncbi:helix-turn-helix domain-containing protein [Cellulosilyticum lentocellum]|uniref:Helix-turn-helix domain protein n=1 Tax=Cellulosilyticum lentocellum (strain ATCC 49066 / DSM 5427 / NCIMB 11756 / RHM5) TaxID=642492 RepID=F2JQ47_CELLD|nr:helix-turn-helix transcriptional regulator [Cellulosilyticum lentocellum]ADZ82595.1 helix-turn-helix domain protein [Cellulosilyticum lentocellum DSM 5427]
MNNVLLKTKRKEMKLSQSALGSLVGVSGAYIQQLEAGTKNPSIETLKKIADALNIRVNELFVDTLENILRKEIDKPQKCDDELIDMIRNSDEIENVIGALLLFNKTFKYNSIICNLSDNDLSFLVTLLSGTFNSIYESYINMIAESKKEGE